MTKANAADSYLFVVSLCTICLAMLLGELNGLNIMIGDISSAYLMAMTKELIFFKGGPEFGPDVGHLMVVSKTLFGLQSSSKSWHDFLFDMLKELGFKLPKADPDIWMKDNSECNKYMCCCVDNLIAIVQDLKVSLVHLKRLDLG
jgi:Reverse transcriptase (RNA-dependent DNA polymerase)